MYLQLGYPTVNTTKVTFIFLFSILLYLGTNKSNQSERWQHDIDAANAATDTAATAATAAVGAKAAVAIDGNAAAGIVKRDEA